MSTRLTCLCLIVLASVTGVAQSKPGFLLFTDPGKRFSIEFPNDWRWMIISGAGEPIATFIQPRSEAAVIVERERLKQRLDPADITEVTVEIEVTKLKEHQRDIANIVARLATFGGLRGVVVDYNRAGLNEQERVRMYAFPVGDDHYRITCAALATRFERYEAAFEAVVGTLKSADQLRR